MASQLVLVVEDDSDVRRLVCRLLQRAGLDTAQATDGLDGLRRFYELRPELVIMDVTMPAMDGLRTLERIRELSDVPVMLLTTRDRELETVHGFQSGADDCVTKPFGRQELVARAQSLLRRSLATRTRLPDVISDGLVSIDFPRAEVCVRGRPIELTRLEFKLLSAFVQHPGRVLSPDRLLELVWGESGPARGRVKLYVAYLRRKLKQGAGVEPIETVRGFGYRYRPPRPSADGRN